MKILVTGAMGQVGAELIQQGPNRGYEMLATDIDNLDITNQEAVNVFVAEHKPNLIINAAAYTAVDKAESESELVFTINCDGANTNKKAVRMLMSELHPRRELLSVVIFCAAHGLNNAVRWGLGLFSMATSYVHVTSFSL